MSTIQYYEIIHDVLPCYQQQGQGGIEINHRTAPWVLVDCIIAVPCREK